METSKVIEQLAVVAFGTSGETEKILRSAMKHIDDLEGECKYIKDKFIELCDHYIEDLEMLRSVLKENELLKKENEMLWSKQTPLPVKVELIDYEYDIVKRRCPSCGTRLFRDKLFCENCGQALATDKERSDNS